MYNEYFGFKEAPFSIAPDPQFLYMSDRHREALAHLVYGLKTDGGFVLLTGEVGTGKTTVCRCLLGQVPEHSEIAFVLNPKLTVVELLATICDELGIAYPAGNRSNKVFIDAINAFLLDAHSQGRKTVLIIDEAQNLQVDVLEQIRLLTNLETHKQKLLQVIMLGQPELKQMLERSELRQLAQRITARYHLEPLSKNEIQAYVGHRLSVAGVEQQLFPETTTNKLYQLSGGVPRLITPAPLWQWALVVLLLLGGSAFLLQIYLNSQPQKAGEPLPKIPINRAEAPQKLSWQSQEPVGRSSILAYKVLFSRWGQEYRETEGAAARQAEALGLKLILKRGSLGLLTQLNRPAVLKLSDLQGQDFYATLTALSEQDVTLVLAEQVKIVSLATLNKHWFGEFALLWKKPPHYQQALKPGSQGELVVWLEEQMAALSGRSVRTTFEPVLEGQLLEEVQQFQTSAGLEPDGIVGSYTLILLNSRTGEGYPTLTKGQRG